MEKISIKDDVIKLGQALKLAGVAGSGVEAKFLIQDGQIEVNGMTDIRRGRKLRSGDVVTFNGKNFKIETWS